MYSPPEEKIHMVLKKLLHLNFGLLHFTKVIERKLKARKLLLTNLYSKE